MKLGVVGSRDFADLSLVRKILKVLHEELRKYNQELVIVSGGANGPDKEGEIFADKNGLKKIIFKADWTLGKHAGILRNTDIINESEYVISWWDRLSKGTADSVKKAEAQNKLLAIIKPNGDIWFTEIGKSVLAFLYNGESEPVDVDPE